MILKALQNSVQTIVRDTAFGALTGAKAGAMILATSSIPMIHILVLDTIRTMTGGESLMTQDNEPDVFKMLDYGQCSPDSLPCRMATCAGALFLAVTAGGALLGAAEGVKQVFFPEPNLNN